MEALSEVQEDLVVVKDEKDRRTQKTRKTQINHLGPGSANRDKCNRVTTMARVYFSVQELFTKLTVVTEPQPWQAFSLVYKSF